MENIYEIKVENVSTVKYARSKALRECVFNTPDLHKKLRKIHNYGDSIDQLDEHLRDIIRDNGLRIISEKPVARVKDGFYVVDVYFKIAW